MVQRVKPNRHHKHRQLKADQGFVRLEFQVDSKVKQRFEQMVEELAEDYAEPYDERRRKAKARRELFEKGIAGQSVVFADYEARLEALKEELAAVSPRFFKSSVPESRALPLAVAALPDEPGSLKLLLAEYYQRAIASEKQLIDITAQRDRAVEYREVLEVKIDDYEQRLKDVGVHLPEYDIENA